MKSDFELIVHRLPAAPQIKLYFIADLHSGAIQANLKAFEQFVQMVLADKNAYVCILGDLFDNGTKLSVTNCFDATMRPREQKRYIVNALKPLADAERILCLCPGNHEARNKDVDDDPLYDVACKLDLEDLYRPNACFVKLTIGSRSSGAKYKKPFQTYVVCVTHGAGGGIYTGATVNRNERFANALCGVDILAVAHTHKGTITKPSKIVVDSRNNLITQQSMVVVSSCSWLAYGGYALQKMLLPSSAQDPEQPQTVILGGLRNKRFIKTVW